MSIDKKYNIILADPPWHYNDKATAGKRGVEFKYPVMKTDDIANLPVNDYADDNCVLFLWTTFPKLFDAKQVIDKWGFKYKTIAFNWVKTYPKSTEKLFMGMGNWTRSNSEICLMATKGKPKRASASVHSVIISPIEKPHSRKPAEIRDRIVQLCGDLPRIELFATQKIEGWDAVGYDIDKKDIREVLIPKEHSLIQAHRLASDICRLLPVDEEVDRQIEIALNSSHEQDRKL